MTTPGTALLTATAVHFGFQPTVTAVVYPALARVSPAQGADAHRAHSRAITPVVVVVYGALALVGGWVLLHGPNPPALALGATAVAVLVTAVAAAPAHETLGAGYDAERIGRLLRVDRIRALAATGRPRRRDSDSGVNRSP